MFEFRWQPTDLDLVFMVVIVSSNSTVKVITEHIITVPYSRPTTGSPWISARMGNFNTF